MAAPLTLGVLLLLHLVSPIAGAGSTTAHHANVAIENEVAVVRVEEIAPMMLMTSTQTAYLRPWTTTRGSGGRSLKWTLKNSDSDLSYISQYTSKWVTDSLNYDDASSDPAVKGSVALLLSVCEAGQAFNKNYVLDEVEGSDGVTLSARDKKKRLTAGGLKYCRQRRRRSPRRARRRMQTLRAATPISPLLMTAPMWRRIPSKWS